MRNGRGGPEGCLGPEDPLALCRSDREGGHGTSEPYLGVKILDNDNSCLCFYGSKFHISKFQDLVRNLN